MARAKHQPISGKTVSPVTALHSQSPKARLAAWFKSPVAQGVKAQICEIGRRLWQRAYVDGNGGNLSIRVGADLAICTPTLMSKGFMSPADLCLVDFNGNQILGHRPRTSEIRVHLEIMRQKPRALAVCHCHSPLATAFAAAGCLPPVGLVSEFEMSISIGLAPYRTPGTPEIAQLVAKLAHQHDTILMANHGLVTWSHNHLEEAYWRVETVENYCRVLLALRQLGKKPNRLTPAQLQDLLRFKQQQGYVDTRLP